MTLTSAGKPVVTNFLNSPYQGRDIFDSYNLYPLIDGDAVKEWYQLMKNGSSTHPKTDYYLQNLATIDDYYDIVERLSSGYVMNTLNFGQLMTFIAGVRVEREQNDYKSIYLGVMTTSFSTTVNDSLIRAAHTETIVCPNFHLAIRPTDYMNVRFAAYKALARPDYNYRLNRFKYNAKTFEVTAGNPDLATAQAWNYEANTSFFGNDFGLITFSAFYKNITDMYHIVTKAPTQGSGLLVALNAPWTLPSKYANDQYLLTMPYNSKKPTKVWGFEFEHQARFGFLPGLWKNVVLSYNGSLIKSETYEYVSLLTYKIDTVVGAHGVIKIIKNPFYKFVEMKNKLEGQPEFYGNVSLGYDIAGFSARISYFYQSKYTTLFSLTGFSDEIQGAYGRMDFSLKYEYDKHLSFFLNLNNLTNTEEKTYRSNLIDNWEVVTSSQRYGLTGDIGVRYNL